MNFILNYFRRRKHSREVREWRHKNRITKSELEKHNNKIYMREYRQRPGWKGYHRDYMSKWRNQNERNQI